MNPSLLFALCMSVLTAAAADAPQTIRLDDSTLTFLGVTRGTQHFPPQYANLVTANRIYTPQHATVAWIEARHDSKPRPELELLVSDRARTGSVPTEKKSASQVRPGLSIIGYLLDAYPRWDKDTILHVRPYHGLIADGHFVFANPPANPLLAWQATPLPITAADDDLRVILENFVPRAPSPRWPNQAASPSADDCVRLNFTIHQNGRLATNWLPRLVQTADPYGNLVQGVINDYPTNGLYDPPRHGHPGTFINDGYYYRPGLWTAALPWKIRVELTRTSGFTPGEIATLTNLPVRTATQDDFSAQWTWDPTTGEKPVTALTVNGVRLLVLPPLLLPQDEPGRQRLSILIHPDAGPSAPRLHLNLLEATTENGTPIHTPFSPVSFVHYSLDLPDPPPLKTLNLKLAFQKRRHVEFIVDPRTQH